jgi:hypothetical protein
MNCWNTLRATQATTQSATTNVNAENCVDWAISSQADRATGGRFNEQDGPAHEVDEIPRVSDTPRGDDVLWTTLRGVEVGVKLPGGNSSVISTFTRELAERSTPSIEGVIRQAILDDTSMELDAAVFGSGAAVAGVRPAGLLVSAGAVGPTSGGGPDAVIGDIQLMLGAMVTAGVGSRPVLFLNSQDAMSVGMQTTPLGELMFATDLAGGRLLGVEVVRSLNIAQGTAIMVDASNIATAFSSASFDVSDVATVVEADADGTTAPTMAGTAGATPPPGAIGTAGEVPRNSGIPVSGGAGAAAANATARSLWQTLTYFVASFCGNAVDQLRELLGTPSWTISSQAI